MLTAVLLGGCAAGTEDEASPAASPSPSAAPSPAVSSTPFVRTVQVRFAGGAVTGTTGREQVGLGESVVLRIASDVAEQVHVYGYDVEADIPAGGSADVPLTASIPGVFEVELHESGKVLFQLRVS